MKKLSLLLILCSLLLINIALAGNITVSYSNPSWKLLKYIPEKIDKNTDGIADVYTTYYSINSNTIQINVTQNNNDKGQKAYKWASALCSNATSINKSEYNPSTQVWTNTGPLIYGKLSNYGLNVSWCSEYNNNGFVLFGSGSGNKIYRLTFTGNTLFKLYTGGGTEEQMLVYQNESTVVYETVNATIYKWNGIEFVLSPQDIFINNSNPDKLKFGAVDYYPLNITNNALNLYKYDFEGIIIFDGEYYKTIDNKIIDITDICQDYSNCIFNLTDKLEVIFYAKVNNNQVFIDPAYVASYQDITGSNLFQPNMTEGINLGARLSASVLNMDFNSNGETYLGLPYLNSSLFEQGTYVKDGSIYNNFGSTSGLTNIPWWTYNLNGKVNNISMINGSLQFDGVNDYVNISNIGSLNNTLTVSAWINLKTTSARQTIYANSNDDTAGAFWIEVGTLGSWYANSVGVSIPGTVVYAARDNYLTANNWTHIVYTRNGTGTGTHAVYINGVLASNWNNTNTPVTATNFTDNIKAKLIGARTTTTQFLNGSIDDLIIWNRALNATEINQTYQEGLSGRTTNLTDNRVFPVDSRVAYWKLDNNASLGDNATYFTDSWGGNNGSCYGTTCPNATSGLTSGAMRFSGVSQRINAGTSTSGMFSGMNGTVSVWVNQNGLSSFQGIVSKSLAGSAGTVFFAMYTYNGSSNNYFILNIGNQTGQVLTSTNTNTIATLNIWHHLVGTWDGKNICLYIDGKNSSCVSQNYPIYIGTNPLQIGNAFQGSYYFNGSIDEVQIFNRSLTSDEIKGMYYSEVAHFRLDETTGNTTYAVWGSTGTLTNYSSTSSTTPVYNATGGVNGSGAYQFDGVDDYMSLTIAPSLGDISFSAWFNAKSAGGGSAGRIFDNGKLLIYDVSPPLRISISSDGGVTRLDSITISTSTWYHGVFNRYANGTGEIYLNGILVSSGNTGTPLSGTTNPTIGNRIALDRAFNGSIDNVQIFNRALSPSEIMNLYNGTNANKSLKYSTTNGDFKSLIFYNSTQTYWNISLATADTQSRSGIVNPDNSINTSNPNLVSYWALDGNYNDATGRNNGTCTGTSCPNNATGISSNAMIFDGVDDYIMTPLIGTNVFSNTSGITYSAWFNTNTISGTHNIVGDELAQAPPIDRGLIMRITGNIFVSRWANSTGGYQQLSYSSNPVSTNTWYYFVVKYNPSDDKMYMYVNGIEVTNTTANGIFLGNLANKFTIGTYSYLSTYFWNGTIDEVAIYNTSLTQAQITQLYKSGLSQHANTNITLQYRTANSYNVSDPSLVALWGLNNDSSIGENSTYFIDSTGRNNGSCSGSSCPTYNVSGIVGGAMSFVGSNRINLSSIEINKVGQTSFSYSLWVNPKGNIGSWDMPFYKGGTPSSVIGFDIELGSGAWTANIANGTSTQQGLFLATGIYNSWTNLLVIINKETSRFLGYVNGNLVFNGSLILGDFNSSNDLFLGSTNVGNYPFNGTIDEVRIYNRSLSASEIQNLYNLGSYHLNWDNNSAYSSASVIADGSGQVSASPSKFMQFKANLYTNTTEVSPYIINYNISSLLANLCLYSGVGNWIVQCSNYCNFTATNMNKYNITLNGTGTIRGKTNLTNFTMRVQQGGCISIN